MQCDQNNCGKPAVSLMYWPGRPPAGICEIHKLKAEQVTNAIGLYVHFEEVKTEPAEGEGE